ncbi:MAG: hypothetical protein IRZ00_15845 [Gemmatimonadetes bacterium]|nr:hypothetical protein [Gemmatimonadota bacterium]
MPTHRGTRSPPTGPERAREGTGEPGASAERGATRAASAGDGRVLARPALAAGTEPEGAEPAPVSWRATQLSTGFVIFALLALLAVPVFVQHRIVSVRERTIEVAAGARDLTDDVERALAVEVAAVRAYALTGDESYRRTFQQARAVDRRALATLRPITRLLGPEVAASADSLEALLHEWEAVPLSVLITPGATPVPTERLLKQERLFERIVTATEALDNSLRAVTEKGRLEAQRAQSLGAILTAVLAFLALVAVLILARLAGQLRTLANREALLRHQLQASFRSRERLIRGFSHDLKNPLGAVDGYAQLLEGGLLDDPTKLRESASRIRASIDAALRLIDDILDIARADAGELRLARAPVPVNRIARDLVTEFGAQAASAGLTLDADLPDDLPEAEADAARVHQILANLLSNAIKYTPAPGRVGMRAYAVAGDGPRPGQAGWVVVDVWDSGPGIPPEDQERIFQEFTRLAPDSQTGAGIGLAISLRLAHALGGELTVRSAPGEGSVFSLWLPMAMGN